MGAKWLKYNEVKTFVESKNCELATKESEYKNQRANICIKCKCGNFYTTSFYSFSKKIMLSLYI